MITDVWKDFVGPLPDQRLMLVRSSLTSLNFYIMLGTDVGANGNFTYDWQSSLINNTNAQVATALFLNWVEQIDFGYNYTMYNVTNSNQTCWAVLTIPSTFDYSLVPISPVTPLNYSLNVMPYRYDTDRICNFMAGKNVISISIFF